MFNLDYYVGRPIVAVHLGTNEEGNLTQSNWIVELEGGILIKNHDGRRTSPPSMEQLQGTGFLMARYEEPNVIMEFGYSGPQGKNMITEITLTETQYSVTANGEEVWPQAADEDGDGLPPDPSSERVVDGPSEAAVSPQEATEPEGVAESVSE